MKKLAQKATQRILEKQAISTDAMIGALNSRLFRHMSDPDNPELIKRTMDQAPKLLPKIDKDLYSTTKALEKADKISRKPSAIIGGMLRPVSDYDNAAASRVIPLELRKRDLERARNLTIKATDKKSLKRIANEGKETTLFRASQSPR